MESAGARNLAALLLCILAAACGIIALGTDEWTTSSLFGSDVEVRFGPFRTTTVTNGDDFDIGFDADESTDALQDCEGREENCDALRATAAMAILGVLFSGLGALFSLIGICTEKRAVGNIIRASLGVAFCCTAIACIIWAVIIHEDYANLGDSIFGFVLTDVSLGYSWGLLIPAAFFDMCAAGAAI